MQIVYILYSTELDRYYYIGMCEDMKRRLSKHLSNHRGFTAKAKDWKIKYTETYPDRSTALKRERQLKGWKNRSRIE